MNLTLKSFGLVSTAFLAGCGSNSDTDVSTVSLKGEELRRVCVATISAIMGRDPAIFASSQFDSENSKIQYVQYVRDEKTWKYRCKTDGDRVIWASVDVDRPGSGPGRWRDDSRDELIRFQTFPDYVFISQEFSDGSEITTRVGVN